MPEKFTVSMSPMSAAGGAPGTVVFVEAVSSGPELARHDCTARFTFKRPPVMVFVMDGIRSTLPRTVAFSAAVFNVGQAASTSMAAPATCGVAMEVPLAEA